MQKDQFDMTKIEKYIRIAFITLVAFFFFIPGVLVAQTKKEVRFEVKKIEYAEQGGKQGRKETSRYAINKAHVFVFPNAGARSSFMSVMLNMPDNEWEQYALNHGGAYGKTKSDGTCTMLVPYEGYGIVIDPNATLDPDQRPQIGADKDMILVNVNQLLVPCEFEVTMKKEDNQIQQVDISDSIKQKAVRRVIVRGRNMYMPPTPHPIPASLARSNARFGLSPVFICVESLADTLMYWRPYLKQGRDFTCTQERHTAFDLTNDSLSRFVQSGYMHDNETSEVIFGWHTTKPDFRHYKVWARQWCEDYNGCFFKDTVSLFDGKETQDLRFLKIEVGEIDIDTARYHIEGKIVDRTIPMQLNFRFPVASAELIPDSANMVEKSKMVQAISDVLYGERSQLNGIQIIGCTSPEGSDASNEKWGRARAHSIESLLRNAFPGRTELNRIAVSNRTSTWQEVVDSMYSWGMTEMADDMNAVLQSTPNKGMQDRAIRNKPYYKTELEPKVLSFFRATRFNYTFVVSKLLEPSEIVYQYEHDSIYRRSSIKDHYEFEQLFHYLKNRPEELEEQALLALENLKEFVINGEVPGWVRPWPLAAYVYAKCLVARRAPNMEQYYGILWPFVKKQYQPTGDNVVSVNKNNPFDYEQYWNDEAIVVMLANMYFAAGDPVKASFLADNYLNLNLPKYDKIRAILDLYADPNNINDPKLINMVASTSAKNRAIIYAAQNELGENKVQAERYLRRALDVLRDSCDRTDPEILYIEGVVTFRLFHKKGQGINRFYVKPTITESEYDEYSEEQLDSILYDKRVGLQAGFFYNVDRNSEEMDSICFGSDEFMEKYRSEVTEDEFSEIQHDRAVMQAIMRYKNGEQNENDQGPTPEQRNESYGLSMVEACTLQPSLLETMKWDGYFNDTYREQFFFYWERHQQGVPDADIEQQYRAFSSQKQSGQ